MTAASNERKRFLSWPRPVCQEPFTRTFAAAPMFHAIWIIIYPVTTSRARRDCRTPSQKPREKKKDSNKLVGSGSFISEQGKSYANMCRFEQKMRRFRIIIQNCATFVPPRFALLLFLFFLLLLLLCLCVCVFVVLFWCSLRDIHWSGRIQGRSVNELFESTISVLSRPMVWYHW